MERGRAKLWEGGAGCVAVVTEGDPHVIPSHSFGRFSNMDNLLSILKVFFFF